MKLILLAMTVIALGTAVVLCSASGLVVKSPAGQIEYLQFADRGVFISKSLSLGILPVGGRILAANDFDGNGSVDLVLEYDPDGPGLRPRGTFLWRFDGETRVGVTQLGGVATGYSVPAGSCDLNHDGNWEFMMWNSGNKSVKVTEILKSAPYAGGERTILAEGRDDFAQVVGLADMDEDGNTDEILQDPISKALKFRYLDRASGKSVSIPVDEIPDARVAGALNVSFSGIKGLIIDSPDGVKPRNFWRMDREYLSGTFEVGRDDFKAWPIVAVVP